MSWIVLFKTWPSVRTPVMFGGGITIENGFFFEFASASKSCWSIQRRYHFGSTVRGSYVLESSAIALNHPRGNVDCKGHGARNPNRPRPVR